MTIPARTIAQLARLGLTDEQSEAVAAMLRDVEEATEAKAGAALEARRAADRKRKADERERASLAEKQAEHVTSRDNHQLSHVTSHDVTGRPVTSADSEIWGPYSVFPKQEVIPPSPPKGGTSPAKKPKKPVGTLCPEDFKPALPHYLKCDQHKVPRDLADRTAAKLSNWSHTNANREIAWKSNWSMALHKALDEAIEKFRPGDPGPRPPPGRPNGNGSADRGGFHQLAFGDGNERADPGSKFDTAGPSGTVTRLRPPENGTDEQGEVGRAGHLHGRARVRTGW